MLLANGFVAVSESSAAQWPVTQARVGGAAGSPVTVITVPVFSVTVLSNLKLRVQKSSLPSRTFMMLIMICYP
jgi:hypothetical protein